MAIGPGKYDDLATLVREKSGARLVVVSVIGGNKGTGFAVQCAEEDREMLALLPSTLRKLKSLGSFMAALKESGFR